MTVKIEVLNNVRCRMTGHDKALGIFLDKRLAEKLEGAFFRMRRVKGWDGKKHHFSRSKCFKSKAQFPKGLLSRVLRLLKKQKVKPRIIDRRTDLLPPVKMKRVHADMLHGVSMSGKYAHQLDAVKTALEQECGILWLATNAGKTEVCAAITKALRTVTLIIVPTRNLLDQTRERIALRLGTIPEMIGSIGGGRFDPKDITVAIINSVTPKRAKPGRKLAPRTQARNEILREYLHQVRCVFLDEGHHAKASTWSNLMSETKFAQYRYVMSGTPFGSGRALQVEAACGPVIARVTNEELIKKGVSAKPTIRLITCKYPELEEGVEDQMYDDIYKDGIVQNEYRNGIIAREAIRASKQKRSVMILIRELFHGDQLAQLIRGQAPVEYAHGQMPQIAQRERKEWFEEKPGRILIGSKIFGEGVDIPAMRVLIIADAGKSVRDTLQKVGRAVRKKQTGPNTVEVIDFADLTHKWLAKHSLDRYEIYEGENFEIVEEEPKEGKESELDGDESRSQETLPSLSRKDARRRGTRRVLYEAAATDETAAVGAAGVRKERAIGQWRWRIAA